MQVPVLDAWRRRRRSPSGTSRVDPHSTLVVLCREAVEIGFFSLLVLCPSNLQRRAKYCLDSVDSTAITAAGLQDILHRPRHVEQNTKRHVEALKEENAGNMRQTVGVDREMSRRDSADLNPAAMNRQPDRTRMAGGCHPHQYVARTEKR